MHVATIWRVDFGNGAWYVDLAPITDPDVVPVTVARALGCATNRAARRWIRCCGSSATVRCWWCSITANTCWSERRVVRRSPGAAPGLTVLATSREPIGVPGEAIWRVPSLSLADEAIELFIDRARRARPDFLVTEDNAATRQ